MDTFQQRALSTDNTARHYAGEESRKDLVVALLGIAGELGTLSTAYKKFLRDGPAYQPYKDNIKEELGDLLWYLAVLANKFGLTMSEIAEQNLAKTRNRWGSDQDSLLLQLDSGYPEEERFPRKFTVRFSEALVGDKVRIVLEIDGQKIGNPLTDNVEIEDGYRYHDAFHLAFCAVLGWSPVLRKLMNRKRRSVPATDDNEDGGRATVIEEGIVAFVFEYGEAHHDLVGVNAVDFEVLKTAKSMTRRLEVNSKTWHDWERAIMGGYEMFRYLKANRGGMVSCDLDGQTVTYTRGD